MQFSEFSTILPCLRTYRLQAEENLCVQCFLQADAFDTRHTAEIAVYNACLAIAQLGVQPACRLILYVGVHALLMRSLPADTKLHAQGLFFAPSHMQLSLILFRFRVCTQQHFPCCRRIFIRPPCLCAFIFQHLAGVFRLLNRFVAVFAHVADFGKMAKGAK